jgi:hypothetical protein
VSEAVEPRRPCLDREATPQEIEAGRILASELRERYNVRGILIVAAEAGCITDLRCAMRYCFASEPGRFDPLDGGPGGVEAYRPFLWSARNQRLATIPS